jgi:hypothetical protein
MGGNGSKDDGKPPAWNMGAYTGDFASTKKDRDRYNADTANITLVPISKFRPIRDAVIKAVRKSYYIANYKRAFRGKLREGREQRGQTGVQLRVHAYACFDGNNLCLPSDSINALKDMLVNHFTPTIYEDVKSSLLDNQKLAPSLPPEEVDRKVKAAVYKQIEEVVDAEVVNEGKKIYDKYSTDQDFEASDPEVDEAALARQNEEREKRLKIEREKRAALQKAFADEAAEAEAEYGRSTAEAKSRAEQEKARRQMELDGF